MHPASLSLPAAWIISMLDACMFVRERIFSLFDVVLCSSSVCFSFLVSTLTSVGVRIRARWVRSSSATLCGIASYRHRLLGIPTNTTQQSNKPMIVGHHRRSMRRFNTVCPRRQRSNKRMIVGQHRAMHIFRMISTRSQARMPPLRSILCIRPHQLSQQLSPLRLPLCSLPRQPLRLRPALRLHRLVRVGFV